MIDRLEKLEKQIKTLKVELTKESGNKKPKKIEDCKSRDQLKKYFTVSELKEWLKTNKINVKKVTEKHKDDFVKIVWENISDEYETESSDTDESELDSDEEWEYYYE